MSVDGHSHDGEEEEEDVESPDTEEEKIELEWHFWLLALLVVAGGVLVLFPPSIWPNMGFALLAVAVIGWVLKEALEHL